MEKYKLSNGKFLYVHESYLKYDKDKEFKKYLNNYIPKLSSKDIILAYDEMDCKEYKYHNLNNLYKEIKEIILENEGEFDENNFLSIIESRFSIFIIKFKFGYYTTTVRGFQTLSAMILNNLATYNTSIKSLVDTIKRIENLKNYKELNYNDIIKFYIYEKSDESIKLYKDILENAININNIKISKSDVMNYVYFISSNTDVEELTEEMKFRYYDERGSRNKIFNIILTEDIDTIKLHYLKDYSLRINIFSSFKDLALFHISSSLKL